MPTDLIERAMTLLTERYVFPERAAIAADTIRRRDSDDQYEGLADGELCDRLTSDLFELCADKHLRIRQFEPDLHGSMSEAELEAAWAERQRRNGFGIARTERLAGNVGCVTLTGVTDPSVGGRAIAAAMELMSTTHALIFDLRRNRGGSPDGVIAWNSYLFPDSDTLLNTIYDGASGDTRQYWSLAHVSGERYLDRPVYVLISGFTFSAGEEFAYNLKAQRRAVLIGGVTRGGAHPVDNVPLTPTIEITLPISRSVNPVTGTNWEGVGVEPDIAVDADLAFDVAYRAALQHVLASSTSQLILDEAKEALEGLSVAEHPTSG